MEGWIKLHRNILENPTTCKDADHFAVWSYLLLNATHTERRVIFGKEEITLKSGQLITGRKVISEKFKVDESKVQRILKTLENAQQIEQQTSNKNRLITIVKWGEYQQSEQQVEQQVNNKCTTTEQQVNTNKNDKKEKNVINKEKKESSLDSIINSYTDNVELVETLKDFLKMRKSIKAPLTDRALKTLLTNLDKFAADEETKIKILEKSILNNWKGVFELKDKEFNVNHKPIIINSASRNILT